MAAGDVVITRSTPLQGGSQGDEMIVMGTVVLDGSNPTPVDLSGILSAVDGAVVSMDGSSAPGVDPTFLTHAISGATVNVYAWKVTTGGAAGNPDLVASTNNARLAHFIAIGPKK